MLETMNHILSQWIIHKLYNFYLDTISRQSGAILYYQLLLLQPMLSMSLGLVHSLNAAFVRTHYLCIPFHPTVSSCILKEMEEKKEKPSYTWYRSQLEY